MRGCLEAGGGRRAGANRWVMSLGVMEWTVMGGRGRGVARWVGVGGQGWGRWTVGGRGSVG